MRRKKVKKPKTHAQKEKRAEVRPKEESPMKQPNEMVRQVMESHKNMWLSIDAIVSTVKARFGEELKNHQIRNIIGTMKDVKVRQSKTMDVYLYSLEAQ